jgi:hypothetical protein
LLQYNTINRMIFRFLAGLLFINKIHSFQFIKSQNAIHLQKKRVNTVKMIINEKDFFGMYQAPNN